MKNGLCGCARTIYLIYIRWKFFSKDLLLRLKDIEEEDGPTYALQLFADSKAQYNRFMELYYKKMMQSQKERWGNDMLFFATLMEIVH